eukprot:SAG31_NODE_3221_length_4526_cov_2.643099_1_plen_147_part_00
MPEGIQSTAVHRWATRRLAGPFGLPSGCAAGDLLELLPGDLLRLFLPGDLLRFLPGDRGFSVFPLVLARPAGASTLSVPPAAVPVCAAAAAVFTDSVSARFGPLLLPLLLPRPDRLPLRGAGAGAGNVAGAGAGAALGRSSAAYTW